MIMLSTILLPNGFFFLVPQGAIVWYIPSTVFGSFCICAILLLTLLPETSDKPMYNTVEELNRAEAEERDKLKMLNHHLNESSKSEN